MFSTDIIVWFICTSIAIAFVVWRHYVRMRTTFITLKRLRWYSKFLRQKVKKPEMRSHIGIIGINRIIEALRDTTYSEHEEALHLQNKIAKQLYDINIILDHWTYNTPENENRLRQKIKKVNELIERRRDY